MAELRGIGKSQLMALLMRAIISISVLLSDVSHRNIQLKLFAIFMDYSNKTHCGVTKIKCVCIFVAVCLLLLSVVESSSKLMI